MFPLFGIPVGPEILLIVLIVVLLFGASKIPELARATGEATGEFQKGRQEIEQELEEQAEAVNEAAEGTSTEATETTDEERKEQ